MKIISSEERFLFPSESYLLFRRVKSFFLLIVKAFEIIKSYLSLIFILFAGGGVIISISNIGSSLESNFGKGLEGLVGSGVSFLTKG